MQLDCHADYFVRSLDYAQKNAAAVILNMDTPGGLDKSMRVMIQAISESPIPIITYITPTGARAASAGTYLLYASHVAAMAPGTNLGAATPVSIAPSQKQNSPFDTNQEDEKDKQDESSSMEKKIINDAVAYIKGFADIHNRNAEWAEKAVHYAVSITATEALSKNVIDIVADNHDDLLSQIQGRQIILNGQTSTISLNNPNYIIMNQIGKQNFLPLLLALILPIYY